MAFRLEHPRLGIQVIETTIGAIVARSFQDPGPDARSVVNSNPDADGITDETARVGGRLLTMALGVFPTSAETREELVDRVLRFTHPGDRVTLVKGIECGNSAERQITVRRQSAPLDIENPFVADLVVSWQAVEPFWRSMATQTVEVEPGLIDEPGFTFPITFPLTFGGASSEGSGRVDATTTGTAPASLVTRIYGPCVGPSVRNLSNGGRLDFPTLSIGAGSWLELDSSARTVLEDGEAGANRQHELDFATRRWFGLDPGVNELRFVVESSGAGCRAEFTWQDHYL